MTEIYQHLEVRSTSESYHTCNSKDRMKVGSERNSIKVETACKLGVHVDISVNSKALTH